VSAPQRDRHRGPVERPIRGRGEGPGSYAAGSSTSDSGTGWPNGWMAIRPSGPRTRPARGRVRWTDHNRLGGCPPDGLFFLQRSRLLVSIWFLIECTAGAPAVGSDVGDSLTTLCRRKREILPRTPAHVALGCAGRIRGVFITSPIHLWKCVAIRRPACRHDHVLSSREFPRLGFPRRRRVPLTTPAARPFPAAVQRGWYLEVLTR
jgi:hypothetical protein